MTSFRFIHAAYIHLDSPIKGLTGQEGSAAERIMATPSEAFDTLVGHIIQENVGFGVIAGDLYGGDWRDFRIGFFSAEQMGPPAAKGDSGLCCSTATTMPHPALLREPDLRAKTPELRVQLGRCRSAEAE